LKRKLKVVKGFPSHLDREVSRISLLNDENGYGVPRKYFFLSSLAFSTQVIGFFMEVVGSTI
jgi:hypothetical protein